MLENKKVAAGKVYVNLAGRIAREVVEVRNDIVVFINHHLDTGRSAGVPSMCMKKHFTHWADREATLTETERLQK